MKNEVFDLNRDLSFVEVEYEAWALGKAFIGAQEGLAFVLAQTDTRFRAWLDRRHPSLDEYEIAEAHEEYYTLLEDIYPRFLMPGLLLSVWATFESCMDLALDYVHSNTGIDPECVISKRGDITKRAQRYLKTHARIDVCEDGRQWIRLREIKLIRNILAHSNGRLESLRSSQLRKIHDVVRVNNGLVVQGGYLIVKSEYIRSSIDLVQTVIARFVNLLQSRWPTRGTLAD